MGFSDLLSSGRGPGVIGTLIALLVLVGFGTLYIFVFDEGLQGGQKKIEAVIRDQDVEIETLKSQIASTKTRIEDGQKLKAQVQAIEELKGGNEAATTQISDLKGGIEKANADIETAKQNWEDYKVSYREKVWKEAIGRNLGEIKGITSGKVYPNVIIRKVDHTGIRILDSTGTKTIALEDLSEALKDEFQLSKQKAAEIDKGKDNDEDNLGQLVALTDLRDNRTLTDNAIKETENKLQAAQDNLKEAKANIPKFKTLISRKQQEIRTEKQKPLSHAEGMEDDLRKYQAQDLANTNSITILEKAITDCKERLVSLKKRTVLLDEKIAEKKKEIQDKAAAAPAGAAPTQ